jgi:regulator of replication initiation timing
VSDDLLEALLDSRVRDALSDIFSHQISSAIDAKLATFSTTLDTIVSDFKRVQIRCDKLVEENKSLVEDNKTLRRNVSELMQYTRRNDLVIHGIEAQTFAEASSSVQQDSLSQTVTGPNSSVTEEAVIRLCRESLGVPVTKDDISVVHRLASKGGNATSSSSSRGPAPIIVRFTRRKTRDEVFKARKQLKDARPGVYINEHLTPENASLFKQARMLVKQKKLLSAWTANCSVFVKDSELPDARYIKISNLSDLPQ